MANIYSFSRNALLKRIGLTPGKKLLVFLISMVALTIPLGNGYNSIAVVFFVLLSLLAIRRQDVSYSLPMILPVGLFLFMCLSTVWSIDQKVTLKALSKESALLFIPVAFMVNRRLSRKSVDDILKKFSMGMMAISLFLLIRAAYRYFLTSNAEVFFYHELSTMDLNAIYLSSLVSLALMVFVVKNEKTLWGYAAMLFMLFMLFLLSSKNIIITSVILILVYYIFYSGLSRKLIITAVTSFSILFLLLGYYGKIHERLRHEFEAVEVNGEESGVHFVTIGEALTRKEFNDNCYFNGTAFRAYQIRIFNEMLHEEPIFFTGYGLNTSKIKIAKKAEEHKLLRHKEGPVPYSEMNYHNQYVEIFSDLGIFGLLLLLALMLVNTIKAFKSKYFIHIAFSVLMITVFLTESFLWRQRGIVFFTLFYCLFNDMLPLSPKKAAKRHITA